MININWSQLKLLTSKIWLVIILSVIYIRIRYENMVLYQQIISQII